MGRLKLLSGALDALGIAETAGLEVSLGTLMLVPGGGGVAWISVWGALLVNGYAGAFVVGTDATSIALEEFVIDAAITMAMAPTANALTATVIVTIERVDMRAVCPGATVVGMVAAVMV